MIKNKNFAMTEETHKRLKAYAAMQGVPIGEAVKMLLDLQQIPSTLPGPGYREYLVELLKIGNEQGEKVAMQYLKDHPYER